MRIADHFLPTSPFPFATATLPGCPAVPAPPPPDPSTAQRRWDRCHRDRILEPDMLSVEQASAMTRVSEDAIVQLVESGRAIALGRSRAEYRLPFWQFFEPLWSCLPQIRAAFGGDSGAGLLSFLEESSDCMSGMMPRTAVERGHLSHVLTFAKWGYP